MTKKSQIGQIGEDIACEYLINKKFQIIERNFRKPWGELDIITKSPDDTLIFVEVKTIRQSSWQAMQQNNAAIAALPCSELTELSPEENLTSAKLKKLQRTASLYTGHNSDIIDDDKGWRIDLIAIILTDSLEISSIKHYENI